MSLSQDDIKMFNGQRVSFTMERMPGVWEAGPHIGTVKKSSELGAWGIDPDNKKYAGYFFREGVVSIVALSPTPAKVYRGEAETRAAIKSLPLGTRIKYWHDNTMQFVGTIAIVNGENRAKPDDRYSDYSHGFVWGNLLEIITPISSPACAGVESGFTLETEMIHFVVSATSRANADAPVQVLVDPKIMVSDDPIETIRKRVLVEASKKTAPAEIDPGVITVNISQLSTSSQ